MDLEVSLPIKAQWKSWFFGLFTIENVLAGGCIGIISYLYLMGNTAAQTIISMPEKITKGYIFLYLIFFIIEVGFYFLSIYRYQKNESLYWITVLVLFVCPLIRVGLGIDFCYESLHTCLICFIFTGYAHMANELSGQGFCSGRNDCRVVFDRKRQFPA